MFSTAISFLDNLDKNRFFNATKLPCNFNAFHGSPLFGKSGKNSTFFTWSDFAHPPLKILAKFLAFFGVFFENFSFGEWK